MKKIFLRFIFLIWFFVFSFWPFLALAQQTGSSYGWIFNVNNCSDKYQTINGQKYACRDHNSDDCKAKLMLDNNFLGKVKCCECPDFQVGCCSKVFNKVNAAYNTGSMVGCYHNLVQDITNHRDYKNKEFDTFDNWSAAFKQGYYADTNSKICVDKPPAQQNTGQAGAAARNLAQTLLSVGFSNKKVSLSDLFSDMPKSVPELINNIITQVLTIVGAIALSMYVFAGLTWMASAGNQEMIKKAKAVLIWTTLGLIAIFGAYLLTRLVIQAVSP